ncbi:hypothetical protein SNK03_009950 [Fusarium graminearum]
MARLEQTIHRRATLLLFSVLSAGPSGLVTDGISALSELSGTGAWVDVRYLIDAGMLERRHLNIYLELLLVLYNGCAYQRFMMRNVTGQVEIAPELSFDSMRLTNIANPSEAAVSWNPFIFKDGHFADEAEKADTFSANASWRRMYSPNQLIFYKPHLYKLKVR